VAEPEQEEGAALLPQEDRREPRQAAAGPAVKAEPTHRAAGAEPKVEALRVKVAVAERPEFSLEPAGSRATAGQPVPAEEPPGRA
jgi:hypothetical protein